MPRNGESLRRSLTNGSVLNRSAIDYFDGLLALCGKSVTQSSRFELVTAALEALQYYRGNLDERISSRPGRELEERWYASLAAGRPDYGVYSHPFFISESWACWVVYSRKYVLSLCNEKTMKDGVSIQRRWDVRSVADVGNGIGLTTAALKDVWPNARVLGTNVPDTPQTKVAEEVGRLFGFSVSPKLEGEVDLVFASEYFEHFERPVDHLRELLTIGRPKWLVVANSFGSTSIGHFPEYVLPSGEKVSNRRIGRSWNAELRESGYRKLDTNNWNGRPAVWESVRARNRS